MKPDLERLRERFENLRGLYLATLNRAQECDSPDEKKCILQELRSLIAEARALHSNFGASFGTNLGRTDLLIASAHFTLRAQSDVGGTLIEI
jgi:hypothetical protein